MTWVDPVLVHQPGAGHAVPAAWGGTVRDDLEHLVNPPAVSVHNTAGQTVSSSGFGEPTGTVLDGPDKRFDTVGMHSLADPSRLNILLSGRYQVAGSVEFATGNPSGYRVIVDFLVNGSQVIFGDTRFFAANTTLHGVQIFRTLDLAEGDSVEIMAQHNAGEDREVTLQAFTAILQSVVL